MRKVIMLMISIILLAATCYGGFVLVGKDNTNASIGNIGVDVTDTSVKLEFIDNINTKGIEYKSGVDNIILDNTLSINFNFNVEKYNSYKENSKTFDENKDKLCFRLMFLNVNSDFFTSNESFNSAESNYYIASSSKKAYMKDYNIKTSVVETTAYLDLVIGFKAVSEFDNTALLDITENRDSNLRIIYTLNGLNKNIFNHPMKAEVKII